MLLTLGGAKAWAGMDEAMAAYKRGDDATALREWRSLAAQGVAEAQYEFGRMYANGHGVPQDYFAAAKWFRKAARQGHAAAQFNLGLMHRYSQGVTKDFVQSAKWIEKAAAQGDAEALAVPAWARFKEGLEAYNRGDYAAALGALRAAATQGYADAQYELGFMYSTGRGVTRADVQGHMWYNLAAVHGNTIAAMRRDMVAELMTPAQITEAQRLAREWMEKRLRVPTRHHQKPGAGR